MVSACFLADTLGNIKRLTESSLNCQIQNNGLVIATNLGEFKEL